MTFPWLFHDRMTKFHDQNIKTNALHTSWYLVIMAIWLDLCDVPTRCKRWQHKEEGDTHTSSSGSVSCRAASLIYKMLDLLVKFHGFSMTFCPYLQIPWLFHDLGQLWSKFHDFSRISWNFWNSRKSMTFPWPWQPRLRWHFYILNRASKMLVRSEVIN